MAPIIALRTVPLFLATPQPLIDQLPMSRLAKEFSLVGGRGHDARRGQTPATDLLLFQQRGTRDDKNIDEEGFEPGGNRQPDPCCPCRGGSNRSSNRPSPSDAVRHPADG